jgi:GNAT superfamily N-acetyltransferase
MELRPTRAADLPQLHDIFNQAIRSVYEPHAFAPPAPPFEVFANQQRHLLEHDAERCVVAEDRGGPVAFASAWARGDAWFLASLFVRPNAQARRVGSALLDAVWGAFACRRTITDAIQPVSNALYARRGLMPVTPVLAFTGRPDVRQHADLEPTIEADAVAAALRAVDAAGYGFDRTLDHAYWTRLAQRTLWSTGGEVVAYSYAFPGGAIGPVAGRDPEDAAAALTAELARADGEVVVRIPGSSRALVAAALAAGLQLGPTPGLLLLGPSVEPPTSLAVGSYTLL